jgi:hypothetical protein
MHEACTNSLVFECRYEPFLKRLGTRCLYSCSVSNSPHETGHVLEQHDTSFDVCIRGCIPFKKVAKEADNNEKDGRNP